MDEFREISGIIQRHDCKNGGLWIDDAATRKRRVIFLLMLLGSTTGLLAPPLDYIPEGFFIYFVTKSGQIFIISLLYVQNSLLKGSKISIILALKVTPLIIRGVRISSNSI